MQAEVTTPFAKGTRLDGKINLMHLVMQTDAAHRTRFRGGAAGVTGWAQPNKGPRSRYVNPLYMSLIQPNSSNVRGSHPIRNISVGLLQHIIGPSTLKEKT